ncbi:MAG TPA: glycosyltransferase [Edaphobacter sp.]|nr:glycosyltransferase [Edaphobacter sp.]
MSDAMRSRMSEVVDSRRIKRLYYPVPCPENPLDKRRNDSVVRIGYVGRLWHSEKRILDFIPLLKELERLEVPYEFVFIGDGPDRGELEGGVRRELSAPDAIRFTGWISPERVNEEVANLDILVMLSEVEGQPIALLEAMALGAVPVVTSLPGMQELITDGVNGFLLPIGAPAVAARRIECLANDPARRAEMSREASKRVASIHATPKATAHLATIMTELTEATPVTPRELKYPPGRPSGWHVPVVAQSAIRRLWGRELY